MAKERNIQIIEKIANDFAKFRTNFYSSPFEKVFEEVKNASETAKF